MKKSLFLSLALLSLSKAVQAAERVRAYPLQPQEVTITTVADGRTTLSQEAFDAAKDAPIHAVKSADSYFNGALQAQDSFGKTYSMHFVEGLNSKHDTLAVCAAGFTGNASPDMDPYARHLLASGIDCIFVGRSHDAVPHERVKPGGNIYGGRWGDALSNIFPGNFGHVLGYLLRPSTWTEFGGPAARIAQENVKNMKKVLEEPTTLTDVNGQTREFDAAQYSKLIGVGQAFGGWEITELHSSLVEDGKPGFNLIVADSVPAQSPLPTLPGFSKYSYLALLQKLQATNKSVTNVFFNGGKDTLCPETDIQKLLQASSNNSRGYKFDPAEHIGGIYGNRSSAPENQEKIPSMAAVYGGLMRLAVETLLR